MNKKFTIWFNLLLIIIPILSFGQVISPTNPYTKNFVSPTMGSSGLVRQSAQQQTPKLSDIESAFDAYWEGKDYTVKGSGYKPFKRWANHWQDYLQEDGTIAPPAVLWQAWERKQEAESKQTPFSVPDSNVISWSNPGPAVVTNSSISISGQGRINTVIKDPQNSQTLYIGAPAGGIWKSIDDGTNWTPLSDDLPQIGVSGIAIDPTDSNIIYIATGDDDAGDSYSVGVMKSTDAGQTWNTTGLTYLYTNNKTTNEIFIDPTNNSHIWVASTDGLQKSEDGGNTWVIKQQGNIVDFRLHHNYDTNSIIYAVGYNNGESKFYRSEDKGETFAEISSIPTNSNRIILETTQAAPDKVYVLSAYDNGDGTYEGRNSFQGVYVSDDAGLNFNKTSESDDIFGSGQSWYDMALTVSDTDPDILFVGVLNIWKSTDGGDDFTQINSWSQRTNSFTHADIHFLRYFDGVLYAGTDGGVYRSADDGVNFEDLSNTLSIAQIYTVSTSRPDSSKLAGGLQDCGGFALSGSNWNSYHGGDGMGTAVDPFEENTYYGMTQYGGNLYRTTTGGDGGWSGREFIASGPVEGEWVTPLEFAKSGDLYAGYDQLYVLNGGQWKQLSNHNFGHNLRMLAIDPINTNNIYVATYNDVYKSTDRGLTFTNILQTDYYVRDIEIHKTNNNQVWVLSSGTLYSSADQGLSFTSESTDLESARTISHQQYSPDDSLYLGTTLGVYYTDNQVNGWHSISTNLPNVKVSDMEINPYDNILTVSTYGRGIWQTPIPAVTRPSYDLDLVRINSGIGTDFRCENDFQLSFDVYNNGTSSISTFSSETILNGQSQGVENWTGNLAPGQKITLTPSLQQSINFGDNSLSISLSNTSETLVDNNVGTLEFEVLDPPNSLGQTNTTYLFESNEDDWLIVGNPVWEKGVPSGESLNQVNSGTTAYATNLEGNHPDSSSSSLVSPCYDLSQLESGTIGFYLAYELETGYDFIYLQYSIDNGQNWTTIDAYNGFDSELKEYTYDLNQSMFLENITFRFHMVADTYVNEEGAVIDDFFVSGVLSSNDNEFIPSVMIYPNPTNGLFTIDTNGQFELKRIKIFSLESKLIYEAKVVNNSMYEVDFSPQKGIYFIELSTSDQRKIIRKLIVE
tara:strand:+ start:372 stop:3776 length:3405 start_codon:yes stop_codon:yes gene_type:complete